MGVAFSVVIAVLASGLGLGLGTDAPTIAYSTFLNYIESGSVEEVTIDNAAGKIRGVRDGEQFVTSNTERDNTALIGLLEEHDVPFKAAVPQERSFLLQLFISSFPILLMITACIYLMRRMRSTGAGS